MPGTAAAAAAFVPVAWRGAWVQLLLACAAIAAATASVAARGLGGWAPLAIPLAGVAFLVAGARLLRLDQGGVPRGRLSRAIGRLLLVWILTAALLAIVGLLALVAAFAFAYGVASSGPGFVASDPRTWAGAVQGAGRWVLGGVALAAGAGMTWVWVRVSLAPVATARRGRVQVLAAWSLTRGLAWPILGGSLAIAMVPALAWVVLDGLVRILPWDPRAATAVSCLLAALVFAGAWLPMQVGLLTFLYRRVEPQDAGPPA